MFMLSEAPWLNQKYRYYQLWSWSSRADYYSALMIGKIQELYNVSNGHSFSIDALAEKYSWTLKGRISGAPMYTNDMR